MAGLRKGRRENGSLSGFEKREKRRQIRKLQDCISENKIEEVKEMLSEEFDVDFQYRSQTALQLAVREGHLEICRLLIDRGASVDMKDAESNSLLNSACWRGYLDIAQLLVDSKADMDLCNENGASPLNVCAFKSRPEMARILVKSGCDLDLWNTRGQTALSTAVLQNNLDIMKILLEAGCDRNQGDQSYRTPLILAAGMGELDAVNLLLSFDSDVNRQDNLRQTALFHAASHGHLDVVLALIKAGADVNLCTTKGITPLLNSIQNSHIEVAKALIESGCDINMKDRLHHAPIHEAIRQASQFFGNPSSPCINIVELLVSSKADLSICDGEGWTPLYQAAYSGDLQITKLLLKNGASLEASTLSGETILHGGVYGNNPDIVNLLIKEGCRMTEVNSLGHHALMASVISRADIKIVKALIDAGSDLNLPDIREHMSPLHEAIHHHHHDAAILLIDSGCDINCTNIKHQTPLHNACDKGKANIVAHLLKQSRLDRTSLKSVALPLHAAAVGGHVPVVQMLIEAGFDINQCNDGGLTPLQAAIQENKFQVCKTLLKYGCDTNAHAKVTHLMKCCLLQEDTHPHFALEPLFLAMCHKDFDLMKLLILCYVHPPYKQMKTLKYILLKSQDLRAHYSPQNKKEVNDMFAQAMRQPRSLQEITRCHIRGYLGSAPQSKVALLPVANKLKNYILMTEVFLTIEEREKLEEEQLDSNGFVTA